MVQLNTSYILSTLFFLIRHIENNLQITLPLFLTDAKLFIIHNYLSHIANNKLQTGVPDTKINPKGIGEVNEHF